MARIDRIASRTQWKRAHPSRQPDAEQRFHTLLTGVPTPRRSRSYHVFMVASGERDASFQARRRMKRASLGIRPTSSDMTRAFGSRL